MGNGAGNPFVLLAIKAPSGMDLLKTVTYEEPKYQSLVTFSGDIFPLHFYQWRKKVLYLSRGIPMARQGLHIMTFLEGEAKSRLNMSTFTSLPTKEQVLKVLGSHYGKIRSIMRRLIFASKSLGRIQSDGASWEHMHHQDHQKRERACS